MLPTFVIGLREGLEAALIVGIIAAFLRKQGRPELIRQLAVGVAAAVAICLAVGVGLEIFSQNLPQRQQEGLETVIGILAVGMVTYMVIWMKEHSRELKGELESMAADALNGGRGHLAMIAMAFLAVLREGFETSVFLLAAFNESGSGSGAILGAVVGIAVAVALGYGIYRGGVRINLSKFFRATGVVLALVAAGLVVSAIHTAHEAGWLNVGQERLLDLSWLVQPGTVISSLLTGMLGIQPYPVMAEILGWLLYAVPVVVFVAWPPGRAVPVKALRGVLAGIGIAGAATATLLVVTAPSVRIPAEPTGVTMPQLDQPAITAQIEQTPSGRAVRTRDVHPLTGSLGPTKTFPLTDPDSTVTGGLNTFTFRQVLSEGSAKRRLPVARAARLNAGRLPLGVVTTHGTVPATVRTERVLEVVVEPRTDRVLSLKWTEREPVTLMGSSAQEIPVTGFLRSTSTSPAVPAAAVARLAAHDLSRLDAQDHRYSIAWLVGLLGAAGLLGLGLSFWPTRRPSQVSSATRTLIKT